MRANAVILAAIALNAAVINALPQVTGLTFEMSDSDRFASNPNASATISFRTSAGGALATGDAITLSYPPGFFSAIGRPGVTISGDGVSGSAATPTNRLLHITLSNGYLAVSTAVTITLTGLTIDSVATEGGPIFVATSVDSVWSDVYHGGIISGAVSDVSFHIAEADRFVGKTDVGAEFRFKTSRAGRLSSGSNITLQYPPGFFSHSITPRVYFFDAFYATITVHDMTDTQIVLTIETVFYSGPFVNIRMYPMTMGHAPTEGGQISVTTSNDRSLSDALTLSGEIRGFVSFFVAAADRVIGKTGVTAFFSFQTSAGGALATGDAITLSYPPGFFAAIGRPGVTISGDGVTGSAAIPTDTHLNITITSGSVAASTFVTVMLTGLNMSATPVAAGDVTVSTSSEPIIPSHAVSSGEIRGFLSFGIAAADRVAGKTGVAATFSFKTSSGGALLVGSSIILTYPSDFFATKNKPGCQISGKWPTDSASIPSETAINITTATQNISADTAVTVTLTGLTMGAAPTAGGRVTVTTSADQSSQDYVESGVIGAAVSSVAFEMAAYDRAINKAGVAVTFSFRTSAGGKLSKGSLITMRHPNDFFAVSGIPGIKLSGNGVMCSFETRNSNQIIMKTAFQDIPANTLVTITLTGLTMGRNSTAGGPVSVITSVDSLLVPSNAHSGPIRGPVSAVSFQIASNERVAGKTGVAATFSFKTSRGGDLQSGSKITLEFPFGFFAPSGIMEATISFSSNVSRANVAGSFVPAASYLVITISEAHIVGDSVVTVVVHGLTMGSAPMAGSNVAVIASDDDFPQLSSPATGAIGGNVTSVSFFVAAADRVIGKTGVTATFSFQTSAGGALATGDAITLSYPPGFFAAIGRPGVTISDDGVTGSAATLTSSRIIVVLVRGSINASTFVSMNLTSMTMGSQAMTGSLIGVVNVSTSADQLVSASVDAGPVTLISAPSATNISITAPIVTSPLAVAVTPPDHPVVIMTLSGSISSFSQDSERRKSFVSGLAVILGIEQWQIVIRSVKPGSVIVELEFLKNANSTLTPSEITSRLQDASLSGKLEPFGAEGLTVGGNQSHTGIQPTNGISCNVGNIAECSSQFSIVANTQHRWDVCWSCKNSKYRSVVVGGCFDNQTQRLLSPKCSDARSSCLNDNRPGSSFTTCLTPNCNACSTAVPAQLSSCTLLMAISFILLHLISSAA